jgi:hypothetical protein
MIYLIINDFVIDRFAIRNTNYNNVSLRKSEFLISVVMARVLSRDNVDDNFGRSCLSVSPNRGSRAGRLFVVLKAFGLFL